MYVLYLWTGKVIHFSHPNNLLLNHLKTKGNNIWYLGSVMTALYELKFIGFSVLLYYWERIALPHLIKCRTKINECFINIF